LLGLDVAQPTSGAGRATDTLFTNDQDGDPHLTVWNGRDGAVRSGFPRATADIAFFVTPAVVDVDGDGRNEVVAGNGLQMLDAFSVGGASPPGWPKLTNGWVVGTTGSGDWDGDGRAEIAVARRDGVLEIAAHYVIETDAGALVEVQSTGLRHGPPEVLARLAAGDVVDASEYFFRTLVRFSTGHRDWLHLNKVMAIARGQRQARKVLLDLYRLT
jgi:hypothetical protein